MAPEPFEESLDDLWRELYKNSTQHAVSELLKSNLITILRYGQKAGILSDDNFLLADLSRSSNDIAEVCKYAFTVRYDSADGLQKLPVRRICFLFRKNPYRDALELPQSEVDALRRRGDDIVNCASVISYFRNLNAHEHYPIEDPGHVILVAGAFARLIEIAEIPEHLEKDIARIAHQLQRVMRGAAGGFLDEDLGTAIEAKPEIAAEHVLQRLESAVIALEATTESMQAAQQATSSLESLQMLEVSESRMEPLPNAELLSLVSSVDEVGHQLQKAGAESLTKEYFESTLDSRLKEAIEELAANVYQDAPGRETLAGLQEKLGSLTRIEGLLGNSDGSISGLSGPVSDRSPRALRSSSRRPPDVIQGIADDEADYFIEDGESLETSTPPALTPQQARSRLLQLRNKIRRSMQAEGNAIEHWENILQGPVVERMLADRIATVDAWKAEPMISKKYQGHQEKMDKQLAEYGEDVFAIIQQISAKR